jgi:creatinine amidohydrolase/Fe(II)-dependent formamide hydrolase-like protein
LLRSGHRLPENLPGHAQEFETAIALGAFPENVRTQMWTDQPDPTPALATAATGEEFLRRIVERLTIYVQEMIAGKRVSSVPPYFP